MYPRSSPLPTPHLDTSSKAGIENVTNLNWNALVFGEKLKNLITKTTINLQGHQSFDRCSLSVPLGIAMSIVVAYY